MISITRSLDQKLRDTQDAIDEINDVVHALRGLEQIACADSPSQMNQLLDSLERKNLAALLQLLHKSLEGKISSALNVAGVSA